MLDFAHSLTLRAAARGDASPSPALDDLIACGLVVRTGAAGELAVTDAGAAALDRSRPSRFEASSGRLLAVGLTALALGTVIGWIVG